MGVDVAVTWRYIASVDLDTTSSDPSLAGGVPVTDETLGSRSYFDLTGSYTFSDVSVFSNVTGRLGINNAMDKDPPLLGLPTCLTPYCNGNTYSQLYDTLGRYIFMGITADF